MIRLRAVEDDADLEAWRAVKLAVEPDDRAPSVEEMRKEASPERLLLLAELEGALAGSGLAHRSSQGERVFVLPRVLPAVRRRDVGTALLHALADHARVLGFDELVTHAEGNDEASVGFASRFGFAEVDRQVEQVRRLGDEPWPQFPAGVEVVSVADRPGLLRDAFDLAVEGYADMATPWPVSISLEEWLRDEATHSGGSFVALADGEIVGFAGLMRDADNPERAEDGLTVVSRDWRRRGLATALKRAELAWAAANGLREVYTWTQTGNDGMRRVNERLGYEYRHVAITLAAALADVERALAR